MCHCLQSATPPPSPQRTSGARPAGPTPVTHGPGQSSLETCTHRWGFQDLSPLFHPPGRTWQLTAEGGETAGAGVSSGAAPGGGQVWSVGGPGGPRLGLSLPPGGSVGCPVGQPRPILQQWGGAVHPGKALERVKCAGVQGSTPPGSVPCLSTPLHQVSRAPKHPMPLRATTHCAPNATTTR